MIRGSGIISICVSISITFSPYYAIICCYCNFHFPSILSPSSKMRNAGKRASCAYSCRNIFKWSIRSSICGLFSTVSRNKTSISPVYASCATKCSVNLGCNCPSCRVYRTQVITSIIGVSYRNMKT